jgi:hypothetical protein
MMAFALAAGSAHALELHSSETSSVALDGELFIYYENTNSGRILGDGSSIAFNAASTLESGLTITGNVSFEFEADAANTTAIEIVDSYVDFAGSFGSLTIGNFDGVYYQAVSSVMDLYQVYGYLALNDGGIGSLGDSVAYTSTDMNGFKFMLQAKHYEDTITVSGDEEWVMQAAMTYTLDNMTFALGAVDNNADAGKSGEALIGFSMTYAMDDLTLMLLVENEKNVGVEDLHLALGASYDFGKGAVYGSIGNEPLLDESYLSMGVTYVMADALSLFAEVSNGDIFGLVAGDDTAITLGMSFTF